MNTTLRIILVLSGLATLAGGCAASATPSETEGTTNSALLANVPQFQLRMRQARRLLNVSASKLDASSNKSTLIGQAIADINQGIAWDNTHLSASEDDRDDSAANVSVQASIASCADDVNCLLEAADVKLKGATTDKGGFRVAAMGVIAQAVATVD